MLALILEARPAWLNVLGQEDDYFGPVKPAQTALDIYLRLLGRYSLSDRGRENILLLLGAGGRTAAMLGAEIDARMNTDAYVFELVRREDADVLGRFLFAAGWDAARLGRFLEERFTGTRQRFRRGFWLRAFIAQAQMPIEQGAVACEEDEGVAVAIDEGAGGAVAREDLRGAGDGGLLGTARLDGDGC